jgi:hypothetical protein
MQTKNMNMDKKTYKSVRKKVINKFMIIGYRLWNVYYFKETKHMIQCKILYSSNILNKF